MRVFGEGRPPVSSDPTIGVRVRQWHKWQTAIIRTVVKRRIDSDIPLTEPYAMGKVVVAADLDHHFLTFQALCQHPFADAMWDRVLRYCASKGALSGEILVQREHFGRCVLSTTWSEVDRETGERVYDALVKSQLVAEFGPTTIGEGLTRARTEYGPAQKPRKNRARTAQKPRRARARVSGSGSGSGSASNPQTPSGEGAGFASLSSDPEADPVARADRPRQFEHGWDVDADTMRAAVIEWADKEASISRDPGAWRAPAASIRRDIREKRPYSDERVAKDFAKIRAKDERGLGYCVRKVIRENRETKAEGNGR